RPSSSAPSISQYGGAWGPKWAERGGDVGSRLRFPGYGSWNNLTKIFHLSYDFPLAYLAYSSRRTRGKSPAASREGENMLSPSEPSPPLSPHRAFVVQFRAETDVAAGHLVGRVEHIVSGQAMTFHTLEALLAFLACMLAERGAGPPEAY